MTQVLAGLCGMCKHAARTQHRLSTVTVGASFGAFVAARRTERLARARGTGTSPPSQRRAAPAVARARSGPRADTQLFCVPSGCPHANARTCAARAHGAAVARERAR
eukprot:5590183-Pleurochrysis_carterae.AAC.3